MKKLIIITEGTTEEQFIKRLMLPYFIKHNVFIVIAEPFGGFRNGKYQKLQRDIDRHLKRDINNVVSTFIDYYRLPTDFPGYIEAMKKSQTDDRIRHLEDAMADTFRNNRFIPYIQKYEFEALLFSNAIGFKDLPGVSERQLERIKTLISTFKTPEEINGGEKSHPSKRLMEIINGYKKVKYAESIALVNGFDSILATCPRFNNWIQSLITIMKT